MIDYVHAMYFCRGMAGHSHDDNTGARLGIVVKQPQQQEYALRQPPTLRVEVQPLPQYLDTIQVHPMEVAEYISHLHKQNALLTTQLQALQYAVQQAAGRLNGLLPPDLQLTANRA